MAMTVANNEELRLTGRSPHKYLATRIRFGEANQIFTAAKICYRWNGLEVELGGLI
jgi:hypothetical protein